MLERDSTTGGGGFCDDEIPVGEGIPKSAVLEGAARRTDEGALWRCFCTSELLRTELTATDFSLRFPFVSFLRGRWGWSPLFTLTPGTGSATMNRAPLPFPHFLGRQEYRISDFTDTNLTDGV